MSVRNSIDNSFEDQDKLFSFYDNAVNSPTGKRFYMVWESHIFHLEDWPACGLLSYLLSILNIRMHPENKTDREQMRKDRCWFHRTAKIMQYKVRMKKDKLKAAIDRLVEAGVIEVDYRQFHHTWIRINLLKLREIETKEPSEDDPFLDDEDVQRAENPPVETSSTSGKSSRSTGGKSSLLPNRINTYRNLEEEEPPCGGGLSSKSNGEFLQRSKQNTPNSVSKYTEGFLQQVCYQLHEINHLPGSVDPSWKHKLRSALKGKKYTTGQINAVLQHVAETFADPSSPVSKPTNPTHFVLAIPSLIRSLQKNPPEEQDSSPPSPEIQKTLDIVGKLQWPNPDNLPKAIRISVNNYHEFVARVVKLEKRLKAGKITTLSSTQRKLLDNFLLTLNGNCLMHPASTVMEEWFRDIYEDRIKWKEWDENVLRDVWVLNSERVQKKLRKWSMLATGTNDTLKVFMEIL